MLSFFYKKKTNADVSPEEVIQGPAATAADSQTNGGTDEFIFVERKPSVTPSPGQGVLPYPPMSYPPGVSGGSAGFGKANSLSSPPTSYLQDVPFELSLRLTTKSISDIMQMQVDGILAFMTRQMSIDESAIDDYNYSFALEHSIQDDESC